MIIFKQLQEKKAVNTSQMFRISNPYPAGTESI